MNLPRVKLSAGMHLIDSQVASTPEQRSTFGTLADIAQVAAVRGVGSPAVVVVGDVVEVGRRIGGSDA